MDVTNLPSYTPPGEYRVDFSVFKKTKNGYIQLYRMLWYAEVTIN